MASVGTIAGTLGFARSAAAIELPSRNRVVTPQGGAPARVSRHTLKDHLLSLCSPSGTNFPCLAGDGNVRLLGECVAEVDLPSDRWHY